MYNIYNRTIVEISCLYKILLLHTMCISENYYFIEMLLLIKNSKHQPYKPPSYLEFTNILRKNKETN